MTAEEWQRFLADLKVAMMLRYSEEQADIIVQWFTYIKGAMEHDLIGDERFRAMMVFLDAPDDMYNLYNHTMARAWAYAPYILKEAGKL